MANLFAPTTVIRVRAKVSSPLRISQLIGLVFWAGEPRGEGGGRAKRGQSSRPGACGCCTVCNMTRWALNRTPAKEGVEGCPPRPAPPRGASLFLASDTRHR